LAAALLTPSKGLPFSVLRDPLLSGDSIVRDAALFSIVRRTQQGASSSEISDVVATLRTFESKSLREATYVTTILLNAAKSNGVAGALDALLDLSRSPRVFERLAAAAIIGFVHGSETECNRLLELLDDPEADVAARSP